MQVVGPHLDEPSELLICWTPDGDLTGGTRIAIKTAMHYSVPTFNLFHDPEVESLRKFIEKL